MATRSTSPAPLMVLAFAIDHHLKMEKALRAAARHAGQPTIIHTLDKPAPDRHKELSVALKRLTRSLDGHW